MTSNSKKFALNILGLAGFVTLLLLTGPRFALAANATNQFCDNIDNTITQINKQLDIKITNIANKKIEQLQTLKSRREKRNLLIQKQRELSDRQMVLRIEKLHKYSKTSIQKQAVDEFKNEVSEAMATRRTAIDQAIQTYRDVLDKNLNENQIIIDTAVRNFQIDTAKALNQAKVECNQQNAYKTSRQHLIDKARITQQNFLQAIKFNNKPVIQAAENFEKDTNQAAQAFNQALQKAQTELSKVFW